MKKRSMDRGVNSLLWRSGAQVQTERFFADQARPTCSERAALNGREARAHGEKAARRRELEGRTALVVGGSGGIGSAVAKALCGRGAAVAVSYASGRERAEQAVAAARAAGGWAAALHGDVRTPEGCEALVSSAAAALGRIDILVYAAGAELYRLALDTDAADWRRSLAVNLDGAFFTAKAALPGMIQRGWGRIVYIGSIWGEAGAAFEVAYSAAKAGLSGLTKALAKEVARSGVTVNAVAPGVIETGMNARFDEEERRALLARIPVGRIGRGEDVASAVCFLAGEGASYITGHVLWVTGGFDPLP